MTTSPLFSTVRFSVLASAFLFGAVTPAHAQTTDSLQKALEPVLAGSWRSDTQKARDQYRHPQQTLEFFGLKPSMTVVELVPGGASAWYIEILAPVLQDKGQYIGASVDGSKVANPAASAYFKRTEDALRAKVAALPAQYGKANIITFDLKAPNFGPANSADMVLTFRNVHNWIKGDEVGGMFKAMYAVLKPGGVLGVVDHRAAPGKTLKEVVDSGYLPVEYVIAEAQAAGFKLDKQSEVNANPKDTRDHVKGVWTLPPVLANRDVDREKYLTIGESDRFTLRFVKPAK